jgi:hypothetical protein
MPVLGTLPNDKKKLVALYANENSNYQTNLGSRSVWKTIAQNPNESPERRAEAKIKFEALNKKVKDGAVNLDKLQKAVDKLDGGKEVTKIQNEYSDLVEQKSLLLDPNDPQVAAIDKKIEALADKYQGAYSKVVGTLVSRTVAKGNLTGSVATFGESTATETAPTPVESGAAALAKKPASTLKSEPNLIKNGRPLPATTSPTTVNPVTGEKIKVSEIGPERPGTPTPKPAVGPGVGEGTAETEAKGLEAAAALDLAGTLFEHVPSLKNLLDQYVKQGWTNNRFLQELRNDTWYKKNSSEIKQRYVQLYNYQDLVASGQADGSTDYEKQIDLLKNQIINKANQMGSGLASDPAAVQRAAENMYITNTGIDDSLTTKILAAAIRPIGSTIAGKPTEGYSGKALQDYQVIQAAAKANGFKVSDIIPGGTNEQQVLQGIATGAIDVERIKQDARKLAAQGQPQYVRDLLGQGYNLDQVYAPYRQTMANILEIGDPNQIDLNDPTLRTAITDKGDMNLFDFKKALRQDQRWQYTDQARQDVSATALNVLRDFGFQG